MNQKNYRRVTGALLVVWMCVIFLFSSQPSDESSKVSGTVCERVVEDANRVLKLEMDQARVQSVAESIEYPVRKAAHMTEYAILGLLSFAYYSSWQLRKKRYLTALGTVFLYACTDEFHQLFVPGRSGQFTDVCIDTAGAVIGLVILAFLLKIVGKHCTKNVDILK